MRPLTNFTLISNIGCAIVAPALFPAIHPLDNEINHWYAVLTIMQKVFPLLICSLLIAMLIRRFLPRLNSSILAFPDAAFYLWAITLTILMGQSHYHRFPRSRKPNIAFVDRISCTSSVLPAIRYWKTNWHSMADAHQQWSNTGTKNIVFAI